MNTHYRADDRNLLRSALGAEGIHLGPLATPQRDNHVVATNLKDTTS